MFELPLPRLSRNRIPKVYCVFGIAIRETNVCKLKRGRIQLRFRTYNGISSSAQPSLWQCLHSFEPATVTPAQRQCVLAAQQADIGGLMTPRHLEGVSRGAAALALWLHTAMQLVGSEPAAATPQEVSLLEAAADRRESLFDAPTAEPCQVCGKLMPHELMAAHVPACRSREDRRESAR